jgi:hypothetical protein
VILKRVSRFGLRSVFLHQCSFSKKEFVLSKQILKTGISKDVSTGKKDVALSK